MQVVATPVTISAQRHVTTAVEEMQELPFHKYRFSNSGNMQVLQYRAHVCILFPALEC